MTKVIDFPCYCWRAGVGFSSNLDCDTAVHDYNILKMKQLEIINKKDLGEESKWLCHLESIYLMIVWIKESIAKGLYSKEILAGVDKFLSSEFIARAREYFQNECNRKLWDEIIISTSKGAEDIVAFFEQTDRESTTQKFRRKLRNAVRKFF